MATSGLLPNALNKRAGWRSATHGPLVDVPRRCHRSLRPVSRLRADAFPNKCPRSAGRWNLRPTPLPEPIYRFCASSDAAADAELGPTAAPEGLADRVRNFFTVFSDPSCNRRLFALALGQMLCSVATLIHDTYLPVYMQDVLGLSNTKVRTVGGVGVKSAGSRMCSSVGFGRGRHAPAPELRHRDCANWNNIFEALWIQNPYPVHPLGCALW